MRTLPALLVVVIAAATACGVDKPNVQSVTRADGAVDRAAAGTGGTADANTSSGDSKGTGGAGGTAGRDSDPVAVDADDAAPPEVDTAPYDVGRADVPVAGSDGNATLVDADRVDGAGVSSETGGSGGDGGGTADRAQIDAPAAQDAARDTTATDAEGWTPDAEGWAPRAVPASGPKSKIVMVVDNVVAPEAGIAALRTHLESRGFKVTYAIFAGNSLFLDAAGTQAVDYTANGLVLVTDRANSSTALALVDRTIPVICSSRFYVAMKLTSAAPIRDRTRSTVSIVAPGDPMAAGLTAMTTFISGVTSVDIMMASVPSSAKVIATGWSHPSEESNYAAVFRYEQGAALASGTAPDRRVGFFVGVVNQFPMLNEKGWSLLDAAVDWAMRLD